MLIKKMFVAASAASLAISPVAAQAAVERDSAAVSETSELGGSALIIAILAGLAVVGGIIVAASDDDDTPVSA